MQRCLQRDRVPRAYRIISVDSLGGDLYWAAGLSLIADIPRRSHWPLKTHFFVNAGRLDTLDICVYSVHVHVLTPTDHVTTARRPILDDIRSCLSSPSITTGVGLIFTHGPARAEINFGVPLVAAKSDRIVRGLQFAVGIDFL